MKVFLTGGSGFLGRHVIQRLSREGHEICGIARSEKSAKIQKQLGARVVSGSLNDISTWQDELLGQDVLIHCAAPVEFWGPWEKFYREITLATRELLEAADRAGVRKFIYISSESVLQDVVPLVGINESFAYPENPNSSYGKAKKLAEEEILKFETQTEAVILRPTFIWGPGSENVENILDKARSGGFVWVDQGRTPIETVHVENIAEAIALACTKGRNREIYFVTDDQPVTVRQFFEKLFEVEEVPAPRVSLPNWIVQFVATLVEKLWSSLGLKTAPPISRFEWSFVGMPRRYDITRIKQVLGYQPVLSIEEGMSQMKG